mmetsp:Transcript_41404/g.67172  ORF Transcript_41404/g.67172 Transcript_41404/m.67172 type:complete len:201 (-) Transcript_41404:2611-3213(-)
MIICCADVRLPPRGTRWALESRGCTGGLSIPGSFRCVGWPSEGAELPTLATLERRTLAIAPSELAGARLRCIMSCLPGRPLRNMMRMEVLGLRSRSMPTIPNARMVMGGGLNADGSCRTVGVGRGRGRWLTRTADGGLRSVVLEGSGSNGRGSLSDESGRSHQSSLTTGRWGRALWSTTDDLPRKRALGSFPGRDDERVY